MRKAIWPLICAATVAYFSYHAIEGEHGLLAWLHVSKEVQSLEAQAAELRAQRRQMEQRVALLQSDHVDPDMLDEQARLTLGFVHPNDLVIRDGDTPD